MKAGKLPLNLLTKLLQTIPNKDPRVVIGPTSGEDAAVVDMGDRYLVAKTDPITFATDLIGWHVVQINANDLAVMGATPKWFMSTLLFPEGTSEKQISSILHQINEACTDLGITIIGGHTEITYDLPRPIAIGCMLGEVGKKNVVLTSNASPGDSIILTKGIAIEGTSILANEYPTELLEKGVSKTLIQNASKFLLYPGISVVKDAQIAHSNATIHSMHDPTEGGIATGLLEIATAAEVGLRVYLDKIPILEECQAFCNALGIDPLGLIASGALLATLPKTEVPELIRSMEKHQIPVFEIGQVTQPDYGIQLIVSGKELSLPEFERDELARWLSED